MNIEFIKCFVFFAALLLTCAAPGCGPQTESDKLTAEISAASRESSRLIEEAARSWSKAEFKLVGGERDEGEKLMAEAADNFGRSVEPLRRAAAASERASELDIPDWHKRYFTLNARLFRDLVVSSEKLRAELLIRKSGQPDEDLVRKWKEDRDKSVKDHQKLLEEIARIESAHEFTAIR